jgi:protein transport protein SEC24
MCWQDGRRLIRVHTLALKTTSQLINTFKSADIDSILSVMIRKAISEIPNKRLPEIRTKLTEWATEVLASYRKHCAKPSSDGQLILPDSLKLLPVYLIGLLKSPLLNNVEGFASLADSRAFAMHLWNSMGLDSLAVHLYPKMYSVTGLDEEEEEEEEDDSDSDSDSDSDGTKHRSLKQKAALPGDPDFYGSYWLPPTVRLGAFVF